FGNSPITYTLAASLTIITCFQFRLHAGLLVATITAVAMVEVVYDNYLLSFFIRLGTTTTGIVVSTLVNMFIFPPDYTQVIRENMKQIQINIGDTLVKFANLESKQTLMNQMKQIGKTLNKTEEFIRFERDQTVFQSFVISKKDEHHEDDTNVDDFKLIHYHLKNIMNLNIKHMTFSEENMTTI